MPSRFAQMTDQTCGQQEAVDERSVEPPEQSSRRRTDRRNPKVSQPRSVALQQRRSTERHGSSTRSNRASNSNGNSNCKCCTTSSGAYIPYLRARMTLACWTSRIFKTVAAAMRSSNLDNEDHPLIDNISLRIHCALCSHSAKEIHRWPMSVAEIAMTLFDLSL